MGRAWYRFARDATERTSCLMHETKSYKLGLLKLKERPCLCGRWSTSVSRDRFSSLDSLELVSCVL